MLIEQLSTELQAKAKKELNEVPNEIENNLRHIRDWLKKQPYSNAARTDDLWLLNFLRGCKFSLQKTKEKLDCFHKVRYSAANLYTDRNPLSPEIQELLKSNIFLPLEGKNNISIIVNWKNADPKKVHLETIMKAGFMLFEIFINECNFCMVTGFHIIIDYTHISFGYIAQANFDFIKKMIPTIQNAYPLRVRGIHLINVPAYAEILMNFAKPLLHKYLDKIFIYRENDYENIFNFIPKDMVPIEFGGEGLNINTITEKCKTKMESYHDWFIEDEKRFSNNKPTFAKGKTTQHVSDSFRKLNLD